MKLKLIWRDGTAKQMALKVLATQGKQKLPLLSSLYPFSHHLNP
ncbi:MAG: hypothetical protein WAY02_01410 [Burkholderiaceae bacterium]